MPPQNDNVLFVQSKNVLFLKNATLLLSLKEADVAGEDIVMLRQRELKRLHVIHKVIEGTMTQTEAAELISLTERQVRRIVARILEEGDEGIRIGHEAGHREKTALQAEDRGTVPNAVSRFRPHPFFREARRT